MGSGHIEVHTWTCGDSGGGRERMCLELLNNDWSDPCTGTCQGVARTVFLSGVLCWDSVLTFIFWLFAYGVKVLTPGLCLVTDPLSNSEYHHQGTKSYAVPQLSQCQLWEFRSSAPGSSVFVPSLPHRVDPGVWLSGRHSETHCFLRRGFRMLRDLHTYWDVIL